MYKYHFLKLRHYIVIVLTTITLFFFLITGSYSRSNNFFVNNIYISEDIDINFSRDSAIDKNFKTAFEELMFKVLLSKDFKKLKNTKISDIKKLIHSFQISEETFLENKYKAKLNVYFNEVSLNSFFGERNLLFSNPKNLSVIFYPILLEKQNIKLFGENIFYQKWNEKKIENDLVNFILPVEDIIDIFEINEIKNQVEAINIDEIAERYNTNNYIVSIMEIEEEKLQIFLKMNLNNNQFSRNISFSKVDLSKDETVNFLIEEIKKNILDLWKELNIVNYDFPLTINIVFNNKNFDSLLSLEKTMNNMQIINEYSIDEMSINKILIRTKYFGNPKKLSEEFSEFDYELKYSNGSWNLKKK